MELFGQQISFIEIFGTVFGIAGVWLTVKKNIWCFPTGIVNVALYALLFYESRLYADASLQIVYIVLLIYGWLQWNKKNKTEKFIAETTDRKTAINLSLIAVAGTIVMGFLFKNYSNASLPYFDSALTSMSLIAQWMIAKKKIENWLIWIVADVLYMGMYIYKHLYLTTVLYGIFILLAIAGWKEWRRSSTESLVRSS